MKNNKYKILVLSDLKENTDCMLQKAVRLSTTIDAEIELLHVKKPTDVIETDSQLSAMRTINEVYVKTDKKIKDLITPFTKDNGVEIKTTIAFGNIKNEIENCIHTCKPDVIVLGNKKRKVLSFIGDNITDFVLKTHQGPVMITSALDGFDPEKELSLDFLKNERQLIEV